MVNILQRWPGISAEHVLLTYRAADGPWEGHRVGTSLHDEGGELVAAARATWDSIKC